MMTSSGTCIFWTTLLGAKLIIAIYLRFPVFLDTKHRKAPKTLNIVMEREILSNSNFEVIRITIKIIVQGLRRDATAVGRRIKFTQPRVR